jgi:uncharacterized membrane protein YdbT with pleckstrin-like domain
VTGEPRIVCTDPPGKQHPIAVVTRLLILIIAALFITGFAFLTISAAVDQGVTVASLLSVFVLVLLFVGIVGALFNPPRR